MRYWLWLLVGCVAWLGSAVAAADDRAQPDCTFWNISTADFYAGTPRPISVPGIDGKIEYYWYWTFRFRYKTNLEVLADYQERIKDALSKSSANEAFALNRTITRLRETMKKIDAGGNYSPTNMTGDELLEQLRWRLAMFISLRTDTGQVLNDLNSGIIRHLVERREGKRFYTAAEIQRLQKKDIPETYDPDHGSGRWVNGVAIFSGLKPQTREFEIRVVGLGQRLRPNYFPDRLIYAPRETTNSQKAMSRPLLRRAMRFFYHKIGQSGEAQLDNIIAVRRANDWLWAWSLQVYLGRFRELELERNPELADIAPLKRRYVYFPYFIGNHTPDDREFRVRDAGIFADVEWGGEKIRVVAFDDGGADARWKELAERQIRSRLDNGEEKDFAFEYESYPVTFEGVDVEDYYRKNFPDLPYLPADAARGLREELTSEQKKVGASIYNDLNARKNSDIERKGNFVLKSPRLFAGKIPAGKVVNGVAIIRWGVTDLNRLLDDLTARLAIAAITAPAAEEGTLLGVYQRLQAEKNLGKATNIAPEKSAVLAALTALAEKELADGDATISDDDRARYGTLAPIGVWLGNLAWEKINERADKNGATDAFFQVQVDGANDLAYVSQRFQQFLPAEGLPPTAPPDSFSEAALQAAGNFVEEEATEKKNEVEDDW
ncbi:hypothetical protein AGMMS49959_07500 [Planctomycetales bacterium]|nr:hypothetical protein AGMMS49959_07500 [Planctomycetales bacterium]